MADVSAILAQVEAMQDEAQPLASPDKPRTLVLDPAGWQAHLGRVLEAYPFLAVNRNGIVNAGKKADGTNVVLYALKGQNELGVNCAVTFYNTGKVTFANIDAIS